MIVSGSTGSGKSEWVMRLLHNLEKMISTPIERVIYGYGELNTNILNLQRIGKIGNVPVTVHSGVPSAEQVRDCAKKEKLLLIFLSSTNQRVCCSFIVSSSASASNNYTRITVPVSTVQ
ncbi:hypothetical protein niasHT_030302 [Heterodera trifolii]|uniref:Uncharacterized protein n=1 Tax=Heterodera trifolii TaxID=157864 RepID=A0ABD2KNC6_9BILA